MDVFKAEMESLTTCVGSPVVAGSVALGLCWGIGLQSENYICDGDSRVCCLTTVGTPIGVN